MALVDRIVDGLSGADVGKILTQNITDTIYRGNINELSDLVTRHLVRRKGLVILFDNIDKGFPTHGLHAEDAAIIRCLLEATRKLQTAFERRGIPCQAVVFVRKDVYDRLVDFTPDRGKETSVSLDWSDIELLKELLLRRFRYQAPELEGDFDEVWARLFDTHIAGENSFGYILQRTFLRPRDILNFVRKCIQIAVSRGHEKVRAEDVRIAEREFSEDMLNDLRFEMRDTFPDFPDVVLSFIASPSKMDGEQVQSFLESSGVDEAKVGLVVDALLWFGFLGVLDRGTETYSYTVAYNMLKIEVLKKEPQFGTTTFCVHPAFHQALSIAQ